MSGQLAALGPEGAALALLILGHVLGDFAFQTSRMVEQKHRWRVLLQHGAVVTVVQLIALAPMLTSETVLLVLGIGVSHVAIDGVKARIGEKRRNSLSVFVGDQLLHLLVLLLVWWAMSPAAWSTSPVLTAVGGVGLATWPRVATGAVYLSAFVFAWHGGNAIVRAMLPDWEPETDGQDLEAGATIGGLERLIVLGLAGQWKRSC